MTDEKTKKPRGARRSEESRAAILKATREELVENGWRKFSVDRVAKRARASKQTIYRWWPSIGTICVEAALELVPQGSDGGRDPAEKIAELIAPLEQALRVGSGHAVLHGALVAACDEKEASDAWRMWQRENIRMPLRNILAEIAAKNLIRRDFDVDSAMDILVGPIVHRIVLLRAPLPEAFSGRQAEAMLKQFAP
ncbi:MAG: TetR/AcrR family transcriptional regulator [Pseudomonadota bacterium]